MAEVFHDITVPLRPPILSPSTDLFTILTPRYALYADPVCSKLQVKFLNCVEAYGTLGVKKNCTEVLYDLNECAVHRAQVISFNGKGAINKTQFGKFYHHCNSEFMFLKVWPYETEFLKFIKKSRAKKMLKERMKQYREGKLSQPFEEHPPLDSYLGLSK